MLKNLKFLVYSLVVTILGCQSVSNNIELSDKSFIKNVENNLAPYTTKSWEEHVAQAKASGPIQKGCEPFFKPAEGKALGSVMLLHGYSACPQQYDAFSLSLSKKGYNVFVPLLPGHGKEQIKVDGKMIDDSSMLPEVDSTHIYDNFAKNIGLMLKDEPGEKVVSGLSVGGVIATKVMLYHPSIYDRGLLMAPFFNAAGPINVLLPALGAIIPNKRMGWGNECEFKRQLGRAGYCNFKIENVAAVRKFGAETLKQVSLIKKPVQIVGVEKDPAASNSAIADALKNLPNSKGCFFEKGATHSMFSKQDNPDVPMFWLKPLEEQTVDYITTGKDFTVVGKSEHNIGLCKSR